MKTTTMIRTAMMALSLLDLGCYATLRIDTELYEGAIAPTNASLHHRAERVLKRDLFQAKKREALGESIKESLGETYVDHVASDLAVAQVANAEDTARKTWTAAKQTIDDAWKAYATLAAAVEDHARALRRHTASESGLADRKALAAAAALDESLAKLSDGQDVFLKQVLLHFNAKQQNDQSLQQAMSAVFVVEADPPSLAGIAAPNGISSRQVGYPLFDEDIHQVLADDEYDAWRPFSTAVFRTWGGNAQFVAKSEGQLVFRQKSLDFDPTPVVGAGTAVAKVAAQVAAAVASSTAGIPLPKLGSSNSDETADYASQANQAKLDADEALLRDRKEAKRAFLLELARLQDAAKATKDPKALQDLARQLQAAIAMFETSSRLDH